MAKRSTPKKQQAGSSSTRRYKTFQNKARKRLIGIAQGFVHSHKKWLKAKDQQEAEKVSSKVTKIKA